METASVIEPIPSLAAGTTPFDVIGPCGRRRRVHPSGPTDTVGDLARALGIDPFALTADGRHQPPHRLLADVDGLGPGTQIGTRPGGSEVEEPFVVEVAVTAGPACSPWRRLPAGRHLVGRSPDAAIPIDDPFLDRSAGVLEVTAEGAVAFVQLSGAVRVRCADAPSPARIAVTPGVPLEVGSSRVEIRPLSPRERSATEPLAGDPWRRGVRRRARSCPPEEAAVPVPDPPVAHRPPAATTLVGGCVGVAGSLLIGLLLGNLLFAAFAMIGAVASFATWTAGWAAARHRTARERTRHDSDRDAFRRSLARAHDMALARHRFDHPSATDWLTEAAVHGDAVWQRGVDSERGITVTVGWGVTTLALPVDGEAAADLLADVESASVAAGATVPVRLSPGGVTAVRGPGDATAALLRSMVLQAATRHGPSVLRVDVAPGLGWGWTAWLPHTEQSDAPVLRITDRAGGLPSGNRGDMTLLRLAAGDPIPEGCDQLVEVGTTGRATVVRLNQSDSGTTVRITAVAERVADSVSRRLAPLVDVADGAGTAAPPREVKLADLTGPVTPATVRRRWEASDGAPRTPIAVGSQGPIEVDLVADGPHALVAGTTGSGKSAFLQALVLGVATHASPDDIAFVLADYKGGATFDACAELPHVAGVLTDLDEGGARRALVGLDAEVRRREALLRRAGAADFETYRSARSASPELELLPRLLIVVDEFAGLAADVPDVLGSLVAVAQRGRSLGVHLVLATQRPAGVVSEDVRANTDLRVALRVNGVGDARDVVDDPSPALFPRSLPGRLALRRSGGDLVVAQSARVTPAMPWPGRLTIDPPERSDADDATAVAEWVAVIAAAAAGAGRPRRPFVQPLPHPLDSEEAAAGGAGAPIAPVGLVDDPAAQCRHPLRWEPGAGSLGLIGSVGAGLTSTLIAVASAACAARRPAELELVVVDAVGDDRLDALAGLAHCAGVVRPHETERLARAIARLCDEIARRRAEPDRCAGILVVAVDGLSTLRAVLADPELAHIAAEVDAVLRDGPAVGVVALLADHGSVLGGATYPVATRWVFERCDDTAAALVPGRPPRCAPGRAGRLWIAGGDHRGCEAQVVRGAPGFASLPTRSDPAAVTPISTLPPGIDRSAVDGCSRPEALAVGLSADDLGVATLAVPPGENLLVLGGARRGVSTALAAIAAAWAEVHGSEAVSRWGEKRAAGAAAAPRLVIVDEAHRVEADDELHRLLGDATVTVCAGGPGEGLRTAYGHWARAIGVLGRGVVLTGGGVVDGELFGVALPRRQLVEARPGLAWIIDDSGVRLAQIARPDPDPDTGPAPGADAGSGQVSPAGSGGSSPRR